jgi:hypothetical protein
MSSQLSIQNINDSWEDELDTRDVPVKYNNVEMKYDSPDDVKEVKPIIVELGKLTINSSRVSNPIVKEIPEIDKRTEAFLTISKKEEIAKILKFTKACNNVKRDENGNFKKCYKIGCTYAHSLDQWNPPKCQFGVNCRFINNQKCKFFHDNETLSDWQSRNKENIPDLPTLCEKSSVSFNKETKPDIKGSSLQVLIVPTLEMAQKAMEMAFEKGIFNLQINVCK